MSALPPGRKFVSGIDQLTDSFRADGGGLLDQDAGCLAVNLDLWAEAGRSRADGRRHARREVHARLRRACFRTVARVGGHGLGLGPDLLLTPGAPGRVAVPALVPLAGRNLLPATGAVIAAADGLPVSTRRSLTWDCGTEMARHAAVTATGLRLFSAHRIHPGRAEATRS